MKRCHFSTVLAVALLTALVVTQSRVPAACEETPPYIAYYFYTTYRCGPCERIEEWARAAIENNFKKEIDEGRLQWRAINVQLPENNHYINTFKLHTKSVIIVEQEGGRPVRWENLQDVWRLYRNQDRYFDYITREVRAFMEKN